MTPQYTNGRVPLSLLVHLGGQHYLMPGTYQRWIGFVRDVFAERGVYMQITPGPNGYRWYEAQQEERRKACARGRCNDAAEPGDSSHGGPWRGTETCAIDVNNWASIPWATYKRLAEKWGFIVLYFSWEKWHLVDPNPWAAPAGAGSSGENGNTPATPSIDLALLRRQKEQTMYIKGTSNPEVYNVFTDANGQVRLRVCLPAEASYAITAGIVTQGYDSTLSQLAADTGYGQKIVPQVAQAGLEVIMIQDSGAVTYALWGPGYWDETTNPDVANGWARVYGNAANLTYAQWNDRKAIGQGDKD